MPVSKLIINYLLTFAVFLAVDLLWLGVIAKNLYNKYLGSFLSDKVNWPAAFTFYALYIVGISVFVIYPAINKNSLSHAAMMGCFFGFITYATYDLTNLATLKNWPLTIVIIDIIWGSVLCTIVSVAGYQIVKWLG